MSGRRAADPPGFDDRVDNMFRRGVKLYGGAYLYGSEGQECLQIRLTDFLALKVLMDKQVLSLRTFIYVLS